MPAKCAKAEPGGEGRTRAERMLPEPGAGPILPPLRSP